MERKAKVNVRVVYGIVEKLEVVLLGDLIEGTPEAGMHLEVALNKHTAVGSWPLVEILKMDFINGEDAGDFVGLVVRCASAKDFRELKALRPYQETAWVVQAKKQEEKTEASTTVAEV